MAFVLAPGAEWRLRLGTELPLPAAAPDMEAPNTAVATLAMYLVKNPGIYSI
jgi:hypothetical protein